MKTKTKTKTKTITTKHIDDAADALQLVASNIGSRYGDDNCMLVLTQEDDESCQLAWGAVHAAGRERIGGGVIEAEDVVRLVYAEAESRLRSGWLPEGFKR